MTNGVGISTYVVDKTKPGLLSALNNTTKITSDIAKKLALEVNVKFPSIADQTKDLKKQFSAASRSMGSINFVGERLGKRGNGLGLLGFDGKALRSDMSLDAVKRHLARLKEIQAKLDDNTLVSASVGEAFKKEQKDIIRAVRALEQYKTTLELVIRTNKKFQTKLTSEASYEQVNSKRRYNSQRHWIDEKVVNQEMDAEKKRREAERKAAIKSNEEIVKENERQFKSRVKAKRNAIDIQTAIDNEMAAREKANQTHSDRTVENIKKEIAALKELRKAENDLDRAQGKKSRNARHNSETNERIKLLEQEAEAVKKAADKEKEAQKEKLKTLKAEKDIRKKMMNYIIRAFSVHQVVQFGQKVAETTGYFQQQQVALEGILQSATKARKVLNDITNFAVKSPFRTDELVRFTKQLSAFGIGSDELFPTVTKLADISAGLGVDMDRIILAYGQVRSASVLRGQELRQFTEAGIPMVDALAKKLTKLNGELVTTADVFELISKRQVSFEMVSSVLSDMTSEGGRFYKMQEELTNTLAGQISKLKDLWTLSLNDLGKSASPMLNGIVKFLQLIAKNAKTVSIAIAAAFPVTLLSSFIRQLLILRGNLEATRAQINKIKSSFAALKGTLMSIGIGLVAGAITGFVLKAVEEANKLKNIFKEIEQSFSKENAKLLTGLDELTKKITSAKINTKEFNDAVSTLAGNYGEFVNDDVIKALQSQGDEASKTAKEFSKIATSVREAIIAYQEYKELKEKQGSVRDEFVNAKTSKRFVPSTNEIDIDDDIAILARLTQKLGRQANLSDRDKFLDELFDKAVTEFADSDNITEGNFRTIFAKILQDAFPAVKDFSKVVNLGWARVRERDGWFAPDYLQELQDANSLIKNNDYDIISKAFENVDLSKVVGNALEQYNRRDEAYRRMLLKSPSKEGERTIQTMLSDLVSGESKNAVEAKKAFEDLNSILADASKSPREVAEAFKVLSGTMSDSNKGRKIEEIAMLYKKSTDILTQDEDVLAKRLNAITDFENTIKKVDGEDLSLQEYFEKWNPALRGDETIKQTQEKIASEYKDLKEAKDFYASKDSDIFKDNIEFIEEKMKVLEKIAGKYYYNVDLSEKARGGAKQLPPELADFLSSLKNAYQRYNESVDKGGIGIGLNYVRTNEMFQEMFGEFFGGAEGEKFKALSGMKVGSQTIGELLSGKFLEGLEEGVIDFKAAALALAEDLEGTNIKSYKQAGKQLRQWVDSTISKDSLNATMNELEKTIKDLTNSFEKTNKEVDLYRKLQENGTVKALGGQIGVTAAMAATPDSVRMQGQIQTLISSLNEQLAAQNIAPLSLGSLSRIDEVYNAIENLGKITMMNNKAFDGTALGKISGDVTNLLKQLLEILIKEAASISGEVYSGNAMNDLIVNATKRLESGQFTLTSKENIARNLGTYDMAAIKTLVNATQEDAKKIFDQFMSDNRLDVIAREGNGKISDKALGDLEKKLEDISKDFPAELRDELLSKLKDLRNKVGEYNASIGAWGSFGGAIRDYRNADKIAKEEYDKEFVNNNHIKARIEAVKLGLSNGDVDQLNTQLALSNERLRSMGVNGEKLAEDLRKLSLANMQKSIQQCQEQFSSMVNSVNAVVDAAKAFANTINKVYDVMNKGENPAWMQDMESFLGDFGDAFGAMIAPMMSIISLVSTLTIAFVACEAAMTPLLIVMGVLIAVAAIVAGIVAAAQQHDRSLQRAIEDLEEQIEDTQTAMKNLDATAERMVGIDKFKKQLESLSLNMNMYHDALEQARLEEEKKNTDEDKVEEYKQNAQEFIDEFKNGLRGMFDEITGSTDELADAISSAMRSAFQSGENAARNMAAVVKENIGNIIEEIMKMNYLKPAIETAMNTLRGGSQDWFTEEFTDNDGNFGYKRALDYFLKRLNNEENVENFEDSMNAISTGYIDLYNSLSDTMKDYLSFTPENSSLSGGISGITEDTARTLEGLANSMLMQMILTNRELSTISQSGFAQVQVSWFNEVLQNSKDIKNATESINSAISDMRDLGNRALRVTMI